MNYTRQEGSRAGRQKREAGRSEGKRREDGRKVGRQGGRAEGQKGEEALALKVAVVAPFACSSNLLRLSVELQRSAFRLTAFPSCRSALLPFCLESIQLVDLIVICTVLRNFTGTPFIVAVRYRQLLAAFRTIAS